MRLLDLSLAVSLTGYLGTWAIIARVFGINLSPPLLLFAAWLSVPYLACVLGAWLVRSQRLPGVFALLACLGTAARGLSVPMAMMSQRRDAQDGLNLVFLPILQLPVTALLLLVTAVVAAISWKRAPRSSLQALPFTESGTRP